jgi:hypothetical protein
MVKKILGEEKTKKNSAGGGGLAYAMNCEKSKDLRPPDQLQ